MSTPFTLRAMQPSDGAALQHFMESDPEPPTMSLVTRFLVDPYQAWKLLKPSMIGVVAETSGVEGIVGAASVAFTQIQIGGRLYPAAYLENLKVHHEFRGQGLGTRLAQWRISAARDRFGNNGVILTGTSSDNTASQATMKKWSSQFVGPVVVLPRPSRSTPPDALPEITVRPAEPRDLAQLIDKSDSFYADYDLYAPLDIEILADVLNGSATVYHYRVAVDGQGTLIAGVMLSERSRLMRDEFRNVPPPVRANPQFPKDGYLRLMEAGSLWFDRLDVGQYLWEYVRWEFRDRISTISLQADARSPLRQVIPDEPGTMQLNIVVAVSSPVTIDANRLIAGTLRG